MDNFFFDGWTSILRTYVLGILGYIGLVFLLRISGKRTLSKLNAFDWVITVAFGSSLAMVLLSRSVVLSDGIIGFALLVGLQFAVTWSSVRARWVRKLVTGEPRLLLHDGQFLKDGLRHARVTEDEVRAAVRSNGIGHLQNIAAVVLETDGSFSVIPRNHQGNGSSLADVQGYEDVPDSQK